MSVYILGPFIEMLRITVIGHVKSGPFYQGFFTFGCLIYQATIPSYRLIFLINTQIRLGRHSVFG